MSRSSLALGLLLGVAGTLAVQRGVLRAIPEAEAGKPKAGPIEREQFHAALDVVLDRYVEPVDTPEVMARGLKHMVAGLDPYSHYLTASERARAQQLQAQGAEAGLVTRLKLDAQGEAELEVVAVHPGSPAAKLGLAAGDAILAVRGQASARMLSNVEAQLLLGGAPGERVELIVDRGAGREPLALELAKPDAKALVEAELLPTAGSQGRAIGRIAIYAFRPGTGEQVKRALAELRRQAGSRPLAGLILDLRGNPGGEVGEAVVIADLFVQEGVLTRTRGRGGVILREELATAAGTDRETPLVVLQDRRSASAAELLAVALQEHGRATVVGERSYGKGTVQELITIPDGSVLSLTIARYYSPKDRLIDGHGVDPDVKLREPSSTAGLTAAVAELDAQILAAKG